MKFKILILITLIAVSGVGYYAFAASKRESRLQSPVSLKTVETKKTGLNQTSAQSKEYTDPAGFKFSYPADLKIEKVDKKDPEYYASLILSSADPDEKIDIDVTSTKYTSIEEWTRNNKQIANDAKDVKLAGLDAKEIEANQKIITIAVDLDALFTVTTVFTKQNEEFWKKANDTVVSTFAFELPEVQEETTTEESAEEDIVFESEEVIE